MFSSRKEPSSLLMTVMTEWKKQRKITEWQTEHFHCCFVCLYVCCFSRNYTKNVGSLVPLMWLLRDTEASETPSPPTLFRTRPVTEKPMTRKMGYTQRNRNTIHKLFSNSQDVLRQTLKSRSMIWLLTSSFKLLCSTLKFILDGATSKVILSPL